MLRIPLASTQLVEDLQAADDDSSIIRFNSLTECGQQIARQLIRRWIQQLKLLCQIPSCFQCLYVYVACKQSEKLQINLQGGGIPSENFYH